MRLMTAEDGAETPMDKYVRFKNDIRLWYQEMDSYGLTKEEQETLKPHFLKSHGVPPSQEQLMTMLMDENICGFSLKDANYARKIVGKKKMSEIPKLHQQVLDQAKSPALGKYVWDCGIGPQMGYSFSCIHACAYSYIAYQGAYLATKWSPIYWNTACLVVNSGSLEVETIENQKTKGTDYAKTAKAIGEIRNRGINLSLININESDYGYKPDEKNNRILYGLKAISGINDETIEKIRAGRPYMGIKDFMFRCPITKTATINLIKAGAFDEIDEDFCGDRKSIMIYFLMNNCDAKTKLNLQNFNGLIQHNLIPQELEFQIRIFNFTKYLKANRKVGQYFTFDEISLSFFDKFLSSEQDKLEVINNIVCIKQDTWEKIYKKNMDSARDYIKEHQEEMLEKYNQQLFKEVWDKYADGGNSSRQEMNALCFYFHEHELANLNPYKYGIKDFNALKNEEVDYFFKRSGKQIPIYKIYSIAGTVLAKDDARTTVTILTTTGVVNVKFSRDQYARYKAQLSEVDPVTKKKTVKEASWFKRGTILVLSGYRREDQFVSKTYSNTGRHSIYKVTEICGDQIKLQHDRWSSAEMIEEEDE